MLTYISILRGINVSGQKKILMADLKALYEGLGFKDIITYIQSGNVVFRTDKKTADAALAKKIEEAIAAKYGFDVPVIIRSLEEMKATAAANPFLKEKSIDTDKLHVTFLGEAPSVDAVEKAKTIDYPPDRFILHGKEIYLHCPINYGDTKLSNKFFESKLKVQATTRNWKTVNKLIELAEGI